MSSEANMATVDKFFKVGAWVSYFSAGVVVLFLILILSRNYVAGQVLIPLGSILLLFHRLWGNRLSKNPELKSLIDDRRKKQFWAL